MKTKNKIWYCSLIVVGFVLILTDSCKKSDQAQVPEVFTKGVRMVTFGTAVFDGEITSNGGSRLSEQGFCCSTRHQPVITDNKVMMNFDDICRYSTQVRGLSSNTDYYVRAYATNSIGTAYGEELSFTTLIDHSGETGTVEDIEGNVYKTIVIGSQVWMAENLKTTKYNDGTPIPLVEDGSWPSLMSAGYCWYDNDISYKSTYGALYNWFVFDLLNPKNICPTGWHVASDDEWHTLLLHLDNGATFNYRESYIAGGMLKETDTTHWDSPNSGATNETGFTALPGGFRYATGEYGLVGYMGTWWSNTKEVNYVRGLFSDNPEISRNNIIGQCGASGRCIKDN